MDIPMQRDFRKKVIYYYNKFAKFYDLSEFFRKGTRQAMVKASGCGPGDIVLEICSGTCELALAFAKEGVRTVAVDLARDMLKIGRQKSTIECLEFLETDALWLPFQDKSFDVVAVSLALHHMPEHVQIKVIKEMARLARSKVIMVEWHSPKNPLYRTVKGFLIRIMDVSEHLHAWMRQDFSNTCKLSGLRIIEEQILTVGFHRLSVCVPD